MLSLLPLCFVIRITNYFSDRLEKLYNPAVAPMMKNPQPDNTTIKAVLQILLIHPYMQNIQLTLQVRNQPHTKNCLKKTPPPHKRNLDNKERKKYIEDEKEKIYIYIQF